MRDDQKKAAPKRYTGTMLVTLTIIVVIGIYLATAHLNTMRYDHSVSAVSVATAPKIETPAIPVPPPTPPLDTALYDSRILADANGDTTGKWPVHTPYPLAGAVLPFNRIVAYYGNFYSANMGVLGEYPVPEMLQKLQDVTASWTAADPTTPAIPAIHYIAVTAQGSPGFDGKYRARMPFSEIDKAVAMAGTINGLTFLDIQPGQSTVQA